MYFSSFYDIFVRYKGYALERISSLSLRANKCIYNVSKSSFTSNDFSTATKATCATIATIAASSTKISTFFCDRNTSMNDEYFLITQCHSLE